MSTPEITVGQIMRRSVPIVAPGDSISVVAAAMIEANLPGVLVVSDGNLHGIITEADFVAREAAIDLPAIVPFFSGVFELDAGQDFDEELRRITAISAQELMSSPVLNIKESATMMELATLMVERRVNPVPVVNDDLQIVGIVTRSDMVRLIAQLEDPVGQDLTDGSGADSG